jgi:hypothetical protein
MHDATTWIPINTAALFEYVVTTARVTGADRWVCTWWTQHTFFKFSCCSNHVAHVLSITEKLVRSLFNYPAWIAHTRSVSHSLKHCITQACSLSGAAIANAVNHTLSSLKHRHIALYTSCPFLICRHTFTLFLTHTRGLGSSVGIATDYGLDGSGIESRWGEIFRKRPDWPWGPPSLLYNGYRVFPGAKAAGAWCWPPTPS